MDPDAAAPAPLVIALGDTEGLLAAAAYVRTTGDARVQILFPHELSRRVAAVADEAEEAKLAMIDVLPTDSVQSLLIPALEKLHAQGRPARWIYGRDETAPVLLALSELVDLWIDEGKGAWRIITEATGDDTFEERAAAIEAESTSEARRWRMVLRAATTSWDWPRMYACVKALADLDEASEADVEWARLQLAEAERAELLTRTAPVREVDGRRLAIVTDPTIGARVRPEVLRGTRGDVEALAFVVGRGRLIVVGTTPENDLSWLGPFLDEEQVNLSNVTGYRVDVTWRGDETPPPIERLVGRESLDAITAVGPVARIPHHIDDRGVNGSRAPGDG